MNENAEVTNKLPLESEVVEEMCKAFILAGAGQHTVPAMTAALHVAEKWLLRNVTDKEWLKAECKYARCFSNRDRINSLLTSRCHQGAT